MDIADKPGEHIRTSAQIYPDNRPVEVPPRPTWTGADPRVAGESTLIDPAEEELKESKKDQRHAYKDYTALLHVDPTLLR
jgi:hypothetical protein